VLEGAGGLVFKAHRLCASLISRLESNNEEDEEGCGPYFLCILGAELAYRVVAGTGPSASSLLFITIKPRVERYTKFMSLKYEPASEPLHIFVLATVKNLRTVLQSTQVSKSWNAR